LLALPLTDTLKRADGPADAPQAQATLDRDRLWRAQTPQAARVRTLLNALAHCAAAGMAPTDEAQALECLGLAPRLVAGAATNLKITSADDLALAGAILTMERG
jgi:2-C-methyl-D-erythritol 4-phosphate cytidylyltransferase